MLEAVGEEVKFLYRYFVMYPQTAQVASMFIFWGDLYCPPDRIGQSYLRLRNDHVTTASISLWICFTDK